MVNETPSCCSSAWHSSSTSGNMPRVPYMMLKKGVNNDSQDRDVGLQRAHHHGQQGFHICISARHGSSTSSSAPVLPR